MKIPEPKNSISALIDANHEGVEEKQRPHMGASQLAHPCDRWLWLSFRWAVTPKFSGRIRRLFRRGHNEESIIVSDLRAIGLDVRQHGALQSRVDFGAHVSGSVDAIIESGVPEAPKKRHVAEFKTHSKKSFDLLEKDGVLKSKPEHWVQMQVYMQGMSIDRALYVAVCKDDDRIYTERVRYDQATADKAISRGQRIAMSEAIPAPISENPSWYQCKFCDGHAFCHSTHKTENVNCRTCAHSTPKRNSTWTCARWGGVEIPEAAQRDGCDAHTLHPDLVPWQQANALDEFTAVYVIDGKTVANGEPRKGVFSSREILANPSLCANADSFVDGIRAELGARIDA